MTIDDILLKILNECGSSKFLHVKSSAQNAYGKFFFLRFSDDIFLFGFSR